MEFGVPNPESDEDLKKERKMILNRICNQYQKTSDPTFTLDQIKEQLKGLGLFEKVAGKE